MESNNKKSTIFYFTILLLAIVGGFTAQITLNGVPLLAASGFLLVLFSWSARRVVGILRKHAEEEEVNYSLGIGRRATTPEWVFFWLGFSIMAVGLLQIGWPGLFTAFGLEGVAVRRGMILVAILGIVIMAVGKFVFRPSK